MSVGVCVSTGPCHSGAIAHVLSRPWGRPTHPLSSAPASFPGPPAWRRSSRERQNFGVPPRPSPPRSPAGAEGEAGGFKAHGCHPATPGAGYLSGLQGPAGLRLSALLEPRRVTAPPARRGASAPLCTPPLPRTPRFPPSPPALLQQPPPLLGAAQPCPGLAPAGAAGAPRVGGGTRPWLWGSCVLLSAPPVLSVPSAAARSPSRCCGGTAGAARPWEGSLINKVTLSREVCLSLALCLVYLRGLFIFHGAVCTRALPKSRSRLGGVRA